MILVYRLQLIALIASAGLCISFPVSSDDKEKSYFRPIELGCQNSERKKFYLISKNILSHRSKIEIIFNNGVPKKISVAAANAGNELEVFFRGSGEDFDSKKVLQFASIYINACDIGGAVLDNILKELKDNVKILKSKSKK